MVSLADLQLKAARAAVASAYLDTLPEATVGDVLLRDASGRSAYPWRRHFTRGYPEEVLRAWRAEGHSSGNDS